MVKNNTTKPILLDDGGITCEDSFVKFYPKVMGVTSLDDFIVNINYDAYFVNGAEREESLKEMEKNIIFKLALKYGLITDQVGVADLVCNDILRSALGSDIDALDSVNGTTGHKRRLELTGRRLIVVGGSVGILGLKTGPQDFQDKNHECSTPPRNANMTLDTSCQPISAFITVQVPHYKQFSSLVVQTQVLSEIRQLFSEGEVVTESIPIVNFVGIRRETIGVSVPSSTSSPEQNDGSNRGLSVFGMTYSTLFAGALVVAVFLLLLKYRTLMRNRAKTKRTAKIKHFPIKSNDEINNFPSEFNEERKFPTESQSIDDESFFMCPLPFSINAISSHLLLSDQGNSVNDVGDRNLRSVEIVSKGSQGLEIIAEGNDLEKNNDAMSTGFMGKSLGAWMDSMRNEDGESCISCGSSTVDSINPTIDGVHASGVNCVSEETGSTRFVSSEG